MTWTSTKPSLLARLRTDVDERAWLAFDRQYGDVVLRYCLGRGLSLADAEDVRQTVLLHLVRAMPKFEYARDRGRFRGYLCATVRHAIYKHFRASRRFRPLEIDLDVEMCEDVVDQDDVWQREWADHHIRRALDTLEDSFDIQSVTIFRMILSGCAVSEIETMTGVRRDAIYKIKQRVRERLTELIADQLRDEELDA